MASLLLVAMAVLDPSPSAFAALPDTAPEGAAARDLEQLLRNATAPVDPDPALVARYRDETRGYRHRIGRMWFAVNLLMMVTVVPLGVLASPEVRPGPLITAYSIFTLGFVLAGILLPRCRSAWTEDLVILAPCVILLVTGGIGCAIGDQAAFFRHQAFEAVTICSAMIFLSARTRVLVALVVSTVFAMCVSGLLSAAVPWRGLVENAVFWTAALTGFSWAGHMQERGRHRLYNHRLERENHLRDMSAISSTLFRGARTDALTQVGNRLLLDERLAELGAGGEKLRDRWLLMVDVDHFKQLNDALGHVAGDECLRTIAATLAGCLRADDTLARYGGEEFAALVRAPEATHAWRIAERMREAVADLPLSNPGTAAGHVTVSIGLAAIGPGGLGSVIARADLALYAAKGAGRDRVAIEPGFERTGYPMPGMAISAM